MDAREMAEMALEFLGDRAGFDGCLDSLGKADRKALETDLVAVFQQAMDTEEARDRRRIYTAADVAHNRNQDEIED